MLVGIGAVEVAVVALARPLRRLWTFSGRMASFGIRESGTRLAFSAAAIALVASAFVGLKGMTASLRGEIVVWAKEALVDKIYVEHLSPTPLAQQGPGGSQAGGAKPGQLGTIPATAAPAYPFRRCSGGV